MLSIRGVSRSFGDKRVLDDVSFDVPDGRITGFVGANGAGKTTTMRIVMGILAASAGEVLWAGRPATTADRQTFGYMPEERGLYAKQPLIDQLVYLGRLQGMPRERADRVGRQLLAEFGLGDRLGDKLEALSLGNQQRVQIIAAVMADPVCLVLDEPFSGLDPVAVDAMVDVLRTHTARGVPVLFSSHQLDLVDRLCDQIVVLSQGRLVARGTSEELRRTARPRYRLESSADLGWVQGMRGVEVCSQEPSAVVVDLHGADEREQAAARQALLTEAMARGEVLDFGRVRPSLSEIYREVTA